MGAAARLESIADVDQLAIYDARESFNPRPTDLLNRLAIRGFRPMLPGPVVDHALVPDTVDAGLVAGVGGDKTLYIGSTAHEFNESKLPFAALLRNIPARVALARAGLPGPLAARYAKEADDDTHVGGWSGRHGRNLPQPRGSVVTTAGRSDRANVGLRLPMGVGLANGSRGGALRRRAVRLRHSWGAPVWRRRSATRRRRPSRMRCMRTGSALSPASGWVLLTTAIASPRSSMRATGRSEETQGYALARELATHLER